MKLRHMMIVTAALALYLVAFRGTCTSFDTARRGFGVPGRYAEWDIGLFRLTYLNTSVHGLRVELQTVAGTETTLWRGARW